MKRAQRIPDAELTLMRLIWDCRDGEGGYRYVSTAELMERLDSGWSVSTVFTLLSRLVERGFLTAEKRGRSNWYRAEVAEADYRRAQTKQFVDKLYAGSVRNMVAALCDEAVSEKELDELAALLEEKRRRL